MKIFVTGATGFLGSHLVDALTAKGHTVVCLVRDPDKAWRVFSNRQPETVRGDLEDVDALRAGVPGADVVYHLAGVTSAPNRRDMFAVNVEGTRRLVEVVATYAPGLQRFVFISSQAAGGPSRIGYARTEDDVSTPVSEYGESKLAAEQVVRAMSAPWTIIRPVSVYGPRDVEFLPLFKAANLGIVPLLGAPHQELSLIHVRDLTAALVRATTPQSASQMFYACHGEVVTARELVMLVYRAVRAGRDSRPSGPRIVETPAWLTRAALTASGAAARIAGRSTLLNRDKAKELLQEAWTCSPRALERACDWKAELALAAGLQDTVQWYREQHKL